MCFLHIFAQIINANFPQNSLLESTVYILLWLATFWQTFHAKINECKDKHAEMLCWVGTCVYSSYACATEYGEKPMLASTIKAYIKTVGLILWSSLMKVFSNIKWSSA